MKKYICVIGFWRYKKKRLIYTKPKLRDLSQGSRIVFVRQFRFLTQDDVSDKLGLTSECKRRTTKKRLIEFNSFSYNNY